MKFYVGTSGYSYSEWKGSFYPEKLPSKKMLNFYSQHFSTVESNYTFRKMPEQSVLQAWADEVPADFCFAMKAPQQITHFKRLQEVGDQVQHVFATASVLKDRLGPILFQLPGNFQKDLPRLEACLKLLMRQLVAFEFRHESWFDDETYACLRKHSIPICIEDAEGPGIEPPATADWGYVRLRREQYTKQQLAAWIKKLLAFGWQKAYVYFKHEDTASGPKFAEQFLKLAAKAG